MKSLAGEWAAVPSVRFTGDRTPLDNCDAGARDNGKFFLTTGGEVNQKTKLKSSIDRIPPKDNKPPTDLPPQ